MSGSLIALPFQLGARATGLALRGVGELTERTLGLAGLVTGVLRPRPAPEPRTSDRPAADDDLHDAPASASAPPAASAPSPPSAPQATRAPAASEPAAPEPRHISDPPAHISDPPVLVEEVAEAGAEDGAGAQVTVREPWDGFELMKAADVIDRLSGAEPAELAAVELYELANRRRQTVLDACREQFRRRS
jgi:hypothetical protein